MLISFKIQNFKSFYQENIFSMITTAKFKNYPEHIKQIKNLTILKYSAIYGPNAGGKTSFITALSVFKNIVLNGVSPLMNDFAFRGKEKEDTIFDIVFSKDDKIYRYALIVNFKDGEIKEEYLANVLTSKKQEKEIYHDKIINNKDHRANIYFEDYKMVCAKNIPFLSFINQGKNLTSPTLNPFKKAYEFFYNDLLIISSSSSINMMHLKDDESINQISSLLKKMQTGIEKIKLVPITLEDLAKSLPTNLFNEVLTRLNLSIKDDSIEALSLLNELFIVKKYKNKPLSFYRLISVHKGNETSQFDLFEESDGTKRVFFLSSILLNTNPEAVYIVDEITRSMHPLLAYRFIENAIKNLNNNNSQLIFTTHLPNLMNKYLRVDEIWFIQNEYKNKGSSIYPLTSFVSRSDTNLAQDYIYGRFGAIPHFIKGIDD